MPQLPLLSRRKTRNVAGKVEFVAGTPFLEIATAIDDIETDIRSSIESTAVIYLEPAVFESERG